MRLKMKIINSDNALVLILILSVFAAIYSSFNYKADYSINEADVVIAKLTDGDEEISLLNYNEVDDEKVKMLDEMDYKAVKEMLGVKNDFCVYFEDINGNLAKIDGLSHGIGSGNILINGEPCG